MNVLTIDFDIIMRPSIQLYNNLIDDEIMIADLERDFPILTKALPPDLYIYHYLTEFLVRQFKKMDASKVFFVNDHDAVIKLVDNTTDVSLCNIDHHHDIAYQLDADQRIFVPHVGNWVKYLRDKGVVTHYIWVHNPNSDPPTDDLREKYLDSDYELQQMDLDNVPDIDMLIICNSPEWIPSDYQEMWEIWVSIAEAWYGQEFEVI